MAGKTNVIWYIYPDLGLCFRLEDDVLQFCPWTVEAGPDFGQAGAVDDADVRDGTPEVVEQYNRMVAELATRP